MNYRMFLFVILSGAFLVHVSGIDVTCTYEISDNDLYGCKIENLTYVDQNEIIKVLGTHLPDKNDQDVLVVQLFSSLFMVRVVPAQLFLKFPNIEEFYMSAIGLRTINDGNFIDAAKLRHLDVSANSITLIESGSFNGSPNLENINLLGNRLVTLQDGAFEGAINLKVINLQSNRLTSVGTSFLDCPHLEELRLTSNSIPNLEANIFNGLTSLQRLYLDQSTRLISLDAETFTGLENLKILSLVANINMGNPPAFVFKPLIALEELFLEFSKIDHFDADVFDYNLEIKTLSLTHSLRELDTKIFSKLTKLEYLALRNSENFEFVNPELIAENVNLRTLIFYNCNITEISSDAFAGLINLENLDLSYNNLILPDDVFERNVNLKSLKLVRTNLSDTTNFEIFEPLSKLEVLHLDLNTLTTIDSTLLANNPELIELKFTSNKIDSIQSTFLANQLKIEILDFNSNDCVDERFIGIIGGDLTEVYPKLATCFAKYELDNIVSTIPTPTTTAGGSIPNISKDIMIASVLIIVFLNSFQSVTKL